MLKHKIVVVIFEMRYVNERHHMINGYGDLTRT